MAVKREPAIAPTVVNTAEKLFDKKEINSVPFIIFFPPV